MILKLVPRDLLLHLSVPRRIRDYLNTPFNYCESISNWTDKKNITSDAANDLSNGLESTVTESSDNAASAGVTPTLTRESQPSQQQQPSGDDGHNPETDCLLPEVDDDG